MEGELDGQVCAERKRGAGGRNTSYYISTTLSFMVLGIHIVLLSLFISPLFLVYCTQTRLLGLLLRSLMLIRLKGGPVGGGGRKNLYFFFISTMDPVRKEIGDMCGDKRLKGGRRFGD